MDALLYGLTVLSIMSIILGYAAVFALWRARDELAEQYGRRKGVHPMTNKADEIIDLINELDDVEPDHIEDTEELREIIRDQAETLESIKSIAEDMSYALDDLV